MRTIGRVSLRRWFSAAAWATSVALMTGYALPALNAQAKPPVSTVPDVSGVWNGTGAARKTNVLDTLELPLNERAKAYQSVFDEAISPKYYCQPSTAPQIITDPYHMEIVQQPDRVLLRYEKDDVVRTVWLDGRRPSVHDFSHQGISVGRYEQNALIVETTHFVFDITGLNDLVGFPSSQEKRVMERYWREGDKLLAAVTVEDPLFLRKPVQYTTEWPRAPKDYKLGRFDCDPEEARHAIRFLVPKYK